MDYSYSAILNELLLSAKNAVSNNSNTGTSAFDGKIDRAPAGFETCVHSTTNGAIGDIIGTICDIDKEPIVIQPEDSHLDSIEIKPEVNPKICESHSQEQATSTNSECHASNDKNPSTTLIEHTELGEKTATDEVKDEDIDEQLMIDEEMRREMPETVSFHLSNIDSQKTNECDVILKREEQSGELPVDVKVEKDVSDGGGSKEGAILIEHDLDSQTTNEWDIVLKREDTSEELPAHVIVENDDSLSNVAGCKESEFLIEYDVVMKEEIPEQGLSDLTVKPKNCVVKQPPVKKDKGKRKGTNKGRSKGKKKKPAKQSRVDERCEEQSCEAESLENIVNNIAENDNSVSNVGGCKEGEFLIEYDVVMKEEIPEQGSSDLTVKPNKSVVKQPPMKKGKGKSKGKGRGKKGRKKKPAKQSCDDESCEEYSCEAVSLQKIVIKKKKKVNKKMAKQPYQVPIVKRKEEKICDKCTPIRIFNSWELLKNHMKCHNNRRKHACKICRLRYKDVSDLKTHMRAHFIESFYPCGICGQNFSERKEVEAHMKEHKSMRMYTCEICNETVKGSLKEHKDQNHKDIHSCLKCGKRCPTALSLVLHKCYKDEKPIICEICGDVFSFPQYLTYHKTLHGGEITNVCHLCGEGFTHWFYLHRHFDSAHPFEKCYACDECDLKFAKRGVLKRHQKVHSKDRPFPCNVCNARFPTQTTFKIHMRKHTGETPYTCNDCGRDFTYKGSLKEHFWRCPGRLNGSTSAVEHVIVKAGIRKSDRN